jgi:hypothetical protein
MFLRLAAFVLLGSATVFAGQPFCGPEAEVRAELEKVAALPVGDAVAFEQNVAPFQTLRERHPGDLFVHESYQDAVERHGIEGHLRQLTEEYQALALQHPSDLMYRYLSVRSAIGRSTLSAIQQLNEIMGENPEFAPAHRTLAEIYGAAAFRNPEKEKIEREKLLALCPGAVIQKRPTPLPDPSPLIERAEQMLAQDADPDAAAAMAAAGLRADEWRLQRIRPFDWYRPEYKRQQQRELQAEYWRVWSLQVRCYRKAHQPAKAAELLATMEQRAGLLRSQSDPGYAEVAATLAQLRAEEGEKARARPGPQ